MVRVMHRCMTLMKDSAPTIPQHNYTTQKTSVLCPWLQVNDSHKGLCPHNSTT